MIHWRRMLGFKRREKEFYHQLGNSWWDDKGYLNLLRAVVNPWRFSYFRRELIFRYDKKLTSKTLLDIGCGQRIMTEELETLKCRVFGIDPSNASIKAAHKTANAMSLTIDYQVGSVNQLPFPAESFDIVTCSDMLEHISDWENVISEISRILKPEGIFLFHTINRTVLSYLFLIFFAQQIPLTRIFSKGTHRWKMFIRPIEMERVMSENGLEQQEVIGSAFKQSLLSILIYLIKLKRYSISTTQFGHRVSLIPSKSVMINYVGYALKPK